MKKIDSFINCYPVQKTLKFSLIPVGKTEENFENKELLLQDTDRAEEYKNVKKLIDRYHKHFIDSVLSAVVLDDVENYSRLYYKSEKNNTETKDMKNLEDKMRDIISKAFKKDKRYKSLFEKELIKEILPAFLTSAEDLNSIEKFNDFTTYFVGFNENRKNIYTADPQSTAAAYRCINDNLPKFLDNAQSFFKIEEMLSCEDLSKLDELSMELCGVYLKNLFCVDYFNMVLSQSGINKYNCIIGGYTTENGTKVQGLNEYINLYNQQIEGKDKSKKLPFMKILYKQILSDRETKSFIPESLKDDDEVISSISSFFNEAFITNIYNICKIFDNFADYNMSGVFVKSGSFVTDLSKTVFGDWSAVSRGWKIEYEKVTPRSAKKSEEKYYDEQNKKYNARESFSIAELQKFGDSVKIEDLDGSIVCYYIKTIKEKTDDIINKLDNAKALLSCTYSKCNNIKLSKNDDAVNVIKELLDSVKALQHILKALLGTGKEVNKDEVFYGQFLPLYTEISEVDGIYDKVRNYITKKPYSNDKIKLNFENPQLLGGWDKNKEKDYRTVILRKKGMYYLAIMDKSNNKCFLNPPSTEAENCYEKLEYKLLPGPNKMLPKVFFAESNLDLFKPSDKIVNIRKKESFKKGNTFDIKDCHTLIDFFKDSIQKHPDWSKFDFHFSPTENYHDISEFYNEVKNQGYAVSFKKVPDDYINSLVENGYLYLFQIYNKDFSEHSHGKPNLHTMYFKMLFDKENLKDVVYQLNGGAEMFYRKASINVKEKIVHKANIPIDNKNPDNPKKQSSFEYDIVKDKRYTKRQFSLHLPITLNFKASNQTYLNDRVKKTLKDCDDNYIIGIDRGERNLLYICVINSKGEIVEQKSLNTIGNVDYHELLDKKEKERDDARKNWGTIENIKELKEGYLRLVIHEITSLMIKYDAVIAMENLNFGFKKGRFKVEKQVYQKFENMLLSKLNYLMLKDKKPTENGGVLKAYQLTNKVDGVNKARQSGFIFYVPAEYTSKLDPVTGFVNLLYPRYTSIQDSLKFIENIDDIRYNKQDEIFEFDLDYEKFPKTNASFRKRWTVCTNAERIITFRNKDKNNSWDNKTIVLTEEFKKLFDKYGIDYLNTNIKKALLAQSEKNFFESFIHLFDAMLQMRNSVTGNVDIDYLISPVKDKNGVFYDSRNHIGNNSVLPENADANGAYNIARKALWTIFVLKTTDDDKLHNAELNMTKAEWLKFVQK